MEVLADLLAIVALSEQNLELERPVTSANRLLVQVSLKVQ